MLYFVLHIHFFYIFAATTITIIIFTYRRVAVRMDFWQLLHSNWTTQYKHKMKKGLLLVSLVAGSCWAQSNYPITPIPFNNCEITPQSFWGQRLQASRDVTVPLAFTKCEETGRYHNFELAANQLKGQGSDTVVVRGFSFDDTDVYKTIEGCSYLMQSFPNLRITVERGGQPCLVYAKDYIDSVLTIVASAQEPDGYLYTARTMNPAHPHSWAGHNRWEKEEDLSHELYNLGHMIDAAVAHHQATGKVTFLNIAKAYADCVCRALGPNTGQQVRVPGHQIAEMALAKLARVTGDRKYLAEAKFFLDKRGGTVHRNPYNQTHMPVLEQDEAVGHAVRAAYMYAGMADVAAMTGDTSYFQAVDRIWNNIVSKKLYITGGIGSTSNGEAFGPDYDLPNMSAYCETCAAIANVYVNHRMFLLRGDAKYYDVLERTLYNGLLAGVSWDGGRFFYPNPLESAGQHQRQPWYGCACCPSNICRFIPSLPGYIYAVRSTDVYVNLYVANDSEFKVEGRQVEIEQQTNYPNDGYVKIYMRKVRPSMTLKLRVPGWLRNRVVPSDLYEYSDGKRPSFIVKINDKITGVTVDSKGYININRDWRVDDKIEITFDMEPRVVKASPKVAADLGRVAVERGPIVYCAEFADNAGFDVRSIILNQMPKFTLSNKLIQEGFSVPQLVTDAQVLLFNTRGELQSRSVQLNLIPYYAWNHRGQGSMTVWLPQELRATTPVMPPTLASRSAINASYKSNAINAINDRLVPKSQDDANLAHYEFDKKGGLQFIEYTLPKADQIQSCTVYWYEDKDAGVYVPRSWRILYKAYDGSWRPVAGANRYTTYKGVANTVQFNAVITPAIRLEVTQQDGKKSGLFEWEVK